MSKIMSVLEKFNVIEKVSNVISDETGSATVSIVNGGKDDNAGESESTNLGDNLAPKARESTITTDTVKNKNVQAPLSFERNIQINEVYSMFNFANSNINTVFMLGNFINALPENLPSDVKKNSIISILNASNTDLDTLLSDGDKRLTVLNQFANDYISSITSTISEFKLEIVKLEKMIDEYKKQIKTNENLLDEQNHIIKYETQKINGILDFFNDVK